MTGRHLGELARAEWAARESEERFRLIADSAPVPMWVTSLDRKRWFVNRAYVEFLQCSYDEALDYDWRDILHPDDLPRILKEQGQKEAALEPFTLEARYRNGNGWCWLRSHSQPRWGPDGEHIGFIGVAYDISVAKEAELELQRQVAARTAELEGLYNKTPTILHSVDPNQLLVSVSDRWLEFMGYHDRSEVLGRPLSEFMTSESVEKLRSETWPALLQFGQYDDAEYQVFKKSGEVADVIASVRMWRDEDGRFVRTVAALTDITARKRTEEALRQSQKVEAIGQLVGGVAHDFNNLLSPIIGGLDMIKRRQIGDERDQRMVAAALESAERASELVRRLLGFARRQPLKLAAIDLGDLIASMRSLIASTIGPSTELVIEVAETLPPCLGDANQIEMALLNLSVNARDAMPNGGTLTLHASESTAERDPELKPGRYVRLCVSDTGCGMDDATLARAVEPFFSTKEAGRGTGLGLSSINGLAQQLGGAFRLQSRLGEGTTAELWLPCADEPR